VATQGIPEPAERPLLSVDETVDLLGGCIGRSALYEAIRKGECPSLRMGRRVFIPTAALRRWVGLDDQEARS
jgi:excisionase family DNA binding protein